MENNGIILNKWNLIGGIIFNLVSITIYFGDKNFNRQWVVLLLWLNGIVIVLIPFLLFFLKSLGNLLKDKKEIALLSFIFLLSAFLRFYRISEIPILNGDEARDAGLWPEAFLRGEVKDFFGYGVYGISNLFFILASLPHLFFGHSILAVRFFSALFGALAVILVYFLASRVFDKKTGVVSAFLMSAYHVHLHFSRSEFINNFDSFWAVLIIIFLFKAIESPVYPLMLGLLIGLASHFYQGIRAVLLFATIYFLTCEVIKINYQNFKRFLGKVSLFLLGLLLGLGPSLVVILARKNEFFNTGTAGGPLFLALDFWEFIKILPERMTHSYGALVYYPIDFHYRYGGPFLQIPLVLFFLAGILVCLRFVHQKRFQVFLLWIIAVIFFNSVLIRDLNFTHRLLSIIPALVIISGLGIFSLANLFKNWSILRNSILFISVFLAIFFNLKSYFIDSVWKNAYDRNTKVSFRAGKYTADFSPNSKIYFLGNLNMTSKSGSSWEYLAPKTQVEDLPIVDLQIISTFHKPGGYPLIFIALPERRSDLRTIEESYPGGVKKNHYYDGELLFFSYEI